MRHPVTITEEEHKAGVEGLRCDQCEGTTFVVLVVGDAFYAVQCDECGQRYRPPPHQ